MGGILFYKLLKSIICHLFVWYCRGEVCGSKLPLFSSSLCSILEIRKKFKKFLFNVIKQHIIDKYPQDLTSSRLLVMSSKKLLEDGEDGVEKSSLFFCYFSFFVLFCFLISIIEQTAEFQENSEDLQGGSFSYRLLPNIFKNMNITRNFPIH